MAERRLTAPQLGSCSSGDATVHVHVQSEAAPVLIFGSQINLDEWADLQVRNPWVVRSRCICLYVMLVGLFQKLPDFLKLQRAMDQRQGWLWGRAAEHLENPQLFGSAGR